MISKITMSVTLLLVYLELIFYQLYVHNIQYTLIFK